MKHLLNYVENKINLNYYLFSKQIFENNVLLDSKTDKTFITDIFQIIQNDIETIEKKYQSIYNEIDNKKSDVQSNIEDFINYIVDFKDKFQKINEIEKVTIYSQVWKAKGKPSSVASNNWITIYYDSDNSEKINTYLNKVFVKSGKRYWLGTKNDSHFDNLFSLTIKFKNGKVLYIYFTVKDGKLTISNIEKSNFSTNLIQYNVHTNKYIDEEPFKELIKKYSDININNFYENITQAITIALNTNKELLSFEEKSYKNVFNNIIDHLSKKYGYSLEEPKDWKLKEKQCLLHDNNEIRIQYNEKYCIVIKFNGSSYKIYNANTGWHIDLSKSQSYLLSIDKINEKEFITKFNEFVDYVIKNSEEFIDISRKISDKITIVNFNILGKRMETIPTITFDIYKLLVNNELEYDKL